MTEFNTVLLENNAGIATLTINQPKSLNALSSEVLSDISAAVDAVAADTSARVLVITGAGDKAFVAGANIKEMLPLSAEEGEALSKLGNDTFSKIANLAIPSIAQVNGFALGGGSELALAADIRIGSTSARLGQPEVGLGIIPGFGGTQRLSRIVGIAKAKELIYTGKVIKADEALSIGLLNQVVEVEELAETVEKLAKAIMKQAPNSVAASKEAIDKGIEMPLADALTLEAKYFGEQFAHENQTIGMTAFVEKGKPEFK